MQHIVVTGLSGAGKSSVIHILEDIGYYCIDNMPPTLVRNFITLCQNSNMNVNKIAFVVDARSGELIKSLANEITEIKKSGDQCEVLFLEASDECIIKRYKETRRKHPLDEAAHGSIQNAIETERDILHSVRANADYYVDTSFLSTSQLKAQINNIFLDNPDDSMLIKVMSFGFKYGSPNEADLLFDVRCLPNPFYIPELKHHTGQDKEVSDYVMSFKQSEELLSKLKDLVDYLIPLYISEGKSQLVIAFGCTGGKHRSVTFAEKMYEHILENNFKVRIAHRDISKDRYPAPKN